MTEYINKDFYKQIPANERHFIKLSQEAAYAAVKELEAAKIPHSATISEYRSVVTVNRVDSVNAERIAEKAAKEFPNVKKVFGNTEYKAIRDRKYIDTDADTARKIAALLSGNTNNRFSGIIRGEKATITVSGEKNAAAVRAMVENLKNMDLLEALRERGYERTADTNGFVNIRNMQTGEVCGFNGIAAVRDMFDNPENEFFYPLSHRIAYREHPTNGDYYYYIQKYNSADKSSAKVYRDENNKPALFKSVDEVLSYTADNGIEITNIDEEIANWREVDREREDNSIIEENRKLIENFPISNGAYIDLISYNPNTDTFSWTYYNPDSDNGSGAFVDKTITKDDIFAAYSVRVDAENEEQGRNAFIAYLNEKCKEDVIEIYSGYFAEYAGDYINYASKNYAYFFGIAENSTATSSMDNFITHLELNCEEVIKDKESKEQPQEITASSFRVELDGYSGAWNVIENAEIDGRELFMLENDYYGDSVAYIVADKDGNIVDNNVWGDFEEYENTLVKRRLIEAAENSKNGTTMPVLKEFAEDMKKYGFETYEADGIFTANREDVAGFIRMDTIGEILYDISEKYRFEPNEVGNNHLLDLNRFYDSYEWNGFSTLKNVIDNTVIALRSGNYDPFDNYIEQVKSVCENSDGNMLYEESKIKEAEEHLAKVKAVFGERNKSVLGAEEKFPNGELSDEGETAEIPQESNIHFGYFGNGVLCYDTSRLDKEIDDYLSVAHISNEGNIRYYVDDLTESDKQHIENHAKGVKDRFTVYWNGLSLQTRYGMLYDRLLETGTSEQIKTFNADKGSMGKTSDERMAAYIKKYEHSLIFKDEDFPFENAPAVDFQTEINNLVLEKNREAVEMIEVGSEISLNYISYVIKSIDGDHMMSMGKKGDDNDTKQYVGNWKEQLLSEAGNDPLFVYSPKLAKELDFIESVNAVAENINAPADNGEIISDDTDRTDNNVKFLTDNIPDLDNETAERLVNAFAAATLSGWDKGDNQAKINRIKKSLYDILSDEDKTEKAFALISKNVYNHNSDTLDFHFGGNNGSEWFTENELLHNFVTSNRNISFALANALIGYLDEKQHAEREIDELKTGWYDKTDYKIKANIDGEIFDYEGRFDIGDGKGTGGGTLVDHIRQRNEYIIKLESYPYNTKEAKDNARFILDVFVPFLEKYSAMTPEEEKILEEFKENNPIRTSAHKDELSNDDFEIFQVKSGDEYLYKRFMDLSALGHSPSMSDYDRVYKGTLSEIDVNAENKDDILNNIYTKFNVNHPEDFKGHSLSVSDIVVLHKDGAATAHYVDDVGFKDVPEFLQEKAMEQPHTLSVGDIVTFADRPNVWRVSAINDTQIDFENTDQNSMDKMFSHIDFGQHRDNLQEKLKYSVVSQDISVREINIEDKTANFPVEKSEVTVENLVKRYENADFNRSLDSYEIAGHMLWEAEYNGFKGSAIDFFNRFEANKYSEYQVNEIREIIKNAIEHESRVREQKSNSPLGNYNSEVKETAKAPKPKKIPNTIPHRNFKKFKKLFPEFMTKTHTYECYERDSFEPLSAEWIDGNMFSLKHTYVENDNLMCDPKVVFKVDFENETVNAISFENSGTGIYQKHSDGSLDQKDTNSFVVSWLNNIEMQKYQLARYDDINENRVDLTQNSEQSVLSEEKAYIYSEIKFETGEVYLVPDKTSDDNISETDAYKEVLELYADKDNIENLDDMIRVNIQNYRYGSGEESIPNDTEMTFIRENSIDIMNKSEEIGNTEFFAHFWKNVDDVLNDLESKAAEQHKTSPNLGDAYEERTYIFPSDYSSDYPDYNGAVREIMVGKEWVETEEAVKIMNAQGNTDTAQIEALRVHTVSFDGIERSEVLSPEAFHIILDRTMKNKDKMKEAAELYEKNDGNIMPVYTKTPAEATEAGEREKYFADKRENERCAASIRYSISCNNNGLYFNRNKAISELLSTYSIDRIALIIAARVSVAGEWDRRYSHKNLEWAKNVVKAYPSEQVEAISHLGLNSHSVLLDDVAEEFRVNFAILRDMQDEILSGIKSVAHKQQNLDNSAENRIYDEKDISANRNSPMGNYDNETEDAENTQQSTEKNNSAELTELQQKAVDIAKKYEKLPMQDKINIIAQAFGCTTGKVVTSPCTGKWRGTSDISLVFDNGTSLGLGNRITPKAKTVKVQKEYINSALISYNPEIIKATKETALAALKKRESKDNEIAAEKGIKPYTLLNVEFNDGTNGENGGYIGWYYVTLEVDGKIHAHMETGLNYEIMNGETSENPKGGIYRAAGALKDTDVDYVFNNVGFSSTAGLYTLPISNEVKERAERTLDELVRMENGIYLDNSEINKSEEKVEYTDEPVTPKDNSEQYDGQKIRAAFDKLIANHNFSAETEKFLNRTADQLIINKYDSIDPKMFTSILFRNNYGTIGRINEKLFDGELMPIIDEVNGYINGKDVEYVQKENTTAEKNSPMGNYAPQINDVIENDDGVYKVANISENYVTLLETDTLLPDEKMVSMTDFYKSNFTLLERDETISEAVIAEKPVEIVEKSVSKAKNYAITDENLGNVGGAKSRYAANIEAIKLLKSIEADSRNATPAEQDTLAGYTGWGAIPQAFDSTNTKWSSEYAELKELLTSEEYEAARHSTMNAHYTSPTVISAMYDVLNNLGFEKGNILEPAMGTGNFFGMLPELYKDSNLYGVELDSITGRIAQQLYPNADIQIKGYEKTSFPDNSFDVAIGNVPFGDYKISDKRYNDNNFNIHDYFFAKTLDKVHAGGIIAFVTSKGTMDKENDEIRRYIAQRAELLGAVRLPNNAFKATAGTEVTSDILVLQKRERPIEINPDSIEWLKKSETADGLSVNNYFVQHPEMVLGKITEGNKLYGNSTKDTSCTPIEGADLKQQLAEAMKNIKGTYRAADIEIEPKNDDIIPAPANSRKFSFYEQDGNIYYREAEETMKKVNVSKDLFNRAVGMIEIRDSVHELLNLQLMNSQGYLDSEVEESRKKLNTLYDSFVKKYGNISTPKNAKAFKGDNGYFILSALENKDENGKVIGKADIFTKNTLKPKIIAAHVETAEEALILSVSEKGKVDFDFMTELCGMDKDRLISELDGQIYKLPQETEKYVTADEYLSGNIRKKMLDIANSDNPNEYEKNYAALQAAMPPRVEAKDIAVKLGSHWVDPKYIRQFILEKFKPDARTETELNVSYSKVAGVWKIEGQSAAAKTNHTATGTYGTHRKNAYDIIEGILNNSDLVVKDRQKDEYGVEVRDKSGKYILVTNEKETKSVRHCANIIKSEFVDWIFKDPDRRNDLVNKYNEIFNSFRYREYDGSHLNFVGMNTDITLKEHQRNAIARGLYGGNTLLAHAVGAGKTYEMIAIAMEGKRLGLHNKSLFAVPNSLTEQIGNDFRKLYPNANILVATKKDFEKDNRATLLAKMATNDWDAVIVGHSQFDRMGLSPQRESEYLYEEIEKLRSELEKINAENPTKKKSFTVKNIEKSITSYTKRLNDLTEKQVKDDFIDFEQLGFDKIFVDECHMYKNLATATKMRNVAGLGSRGSARAFNLFMKAKYLDELTDGKGCIFSSGTPVSNSMTELYTLMRYLQADTLKDLGIEHFDEWAADFGEVVTDYELKPESDGKYQLKTRFAKFTNLPELMAIFKQAADIRTADTLDLEKPVSVVKEIMAKPSRIQKRGIKDLGERATAIRHGSVDPHKDNMLCVTNDGRKIGLDQRLINPDLPDDPNSKVNMCVQNVFDIYTQTAEKKSTQCIFCDLSTPKTESRQDRFIIYRPNEESDIGYEIIRKKNGIKKDTYFPTIKDYVSKNADEDEDKLKDGDIAVIRRPNEDNTKIISEAAIFKNGKFDKSHSDELLEKLEMSPVEDMPPKEFNIYDDIKNKLVERGVSEKEIAFIHDYDTAEKKQGLFNKMNAGEVRILLGSTSKCGAGMNAQKKMIALHHLDAPMRPSDVDPA